MLNKLEKKGYENEKDIIILKLKEVISKLEQGYSLYDVLLNLQVIINRVKKNS